MRAGYTHLPGLCPRLLVDEANRRIDHDLAHHYDPTRQVEYDSRSYCPALRDHPSIAALLTHDGLAAHLDTLVERAQIDLAHPHGQIAIRRARNSATRPDPDPHIDGIADGRNGVAGPELHTYTFLVGVFLSETPGPFAGNFTVWPGSHRLHADAFRRRGRAALRQGLPKVDRGEPVQLITAPGDVVIAHYQLAHCATVNTSATERRAVYFRVSHRDLPRRKWEHLVDPWAGWNLTG